MSMERSAFAWNLPSDVNSLARRLQATGANRLWVKAGVDNPGLQHAWEQWTDRRLDVLPQYGIEANPWFYIYPEQPTVQYDTISRALRARRSPVISLNAEIEWDTQQADYVRNWVNGLRAVVAPLGVTRIGFSSVPSWDGGQGSIFHNFPYEAFCDVCDFSQPQDYWLDPDQIVFENRRNQRGIPVIPILTACGEMTDDQIVQVAQRAVGNCNNLAGFSAWECANDAYQFDAMRRAYAALPPDLTTEVVVPANDDPAQVRAYLNDQGETILEVNFGGTATSIEGYVVQDAGVSVKNAAGELYDRTLRMPQGFLPWTKRG